MQVHNRVGRVYFLMVAMVHQENPLIPGQDGWTFVDHHAAIPGIGHGAIGMCTLALSILPNGRNNLLVPDIVIM